MAAFEREATRKSRQQARSRFNDESASTQRGFSHNITVLPDGNPMLAAKGRRFATVRANLSGLPPGIMLTVAYSAIFVTTGQKQRGESDDDPDGEGRQVLLGSAD